MKRLMIGAVLAAGLLAACGGGDAAPPQPIALRPVAPSSSFYGEWPVRTYVIRSQQEWNAVFAEVRPHGNPQPVPPPVDFSRDAVLGVSLGWVSACFEPRIRTVTRQEGNYAVHYGVDSLAPGMGCAAVMVAGVAFVLVPQPVGEVTFIRQDL